MVEIEKINAKRASMLLGMVIGGKENYNYRLNDGKCAYFNGDGSPSCVVGHVLAKVGLSINPMNSGNTARFHLLNLAKENFTPKAIRLLRIAQKNQDTGSTWGQAAELAMEGVDSDAPVW